MSNYSSVRINPMDSADQSDIEQNIETNLGLISSWLPLTSERSHKTSVLIGAGPSLGSNLKCGLIHKDMFPSEDYELFTCKHALPLLMEYGFTNLKCIVLDPRPIDGISTHDIKRRDLYDTTTPEAVEFLVASMTNSSVTQYLLDRGFKVIGWHASSRAIEKFKERVPFHLGGGTNSILRGVGIGRDCYGIHKVIMIGLDSSFEDPPRDELDNPDSKWHTELDSVTGSKKYVQSFFGPGEGLNSNRFLAKWTSGEMLAQIQDIEFFFNNAKQLDVEFKVIGTDKGRSLIGQIADQMGVS